MPPGLYHVGTAKSMASLLREKFIFYLKCLSSSKLSMVNACLVCTVCSWFAYGFLTIGPHGPYARTPQGPPPAPGPRALPHPGHDLRLVIHSRNGAKPTSPRTRKLARFLPGLGTSATARMHKPLGAHPQASPLPTARYCIEECLPNHPLFSCSASHRSAVQPSEHCCPPVETTLGLPKAHRLKKDSIPGKFA